MEDEKLREEICNNGFFIMRNYLKNFSKTVRFIKKIFENRENEEIFNWKGINGNNVYVRNINRQAYDFFNLPIMQYIKLYRENEEKEMEIIENNNYYDFSYVKKWLKEEHYKAEKLFILMKKNHNFFIYVFKDLLEKMNKLFNMEYVLCSVKLHRLHPGALEQEIHRDGKHIDKYGKHLLIIMIPLHDTIKELSTIFYPMKEMVHLPNYVCLFENLSNELKEKFMKVKVQNELSIGDVVVQNGSVFHHGPKNNTNTIREFLFLELHEPGT
tara:strand:+ start:3346 stop:4155 length:810 start_codon:yes stop_codon:yes gene_type:complete